VSLGSDFEILRQPNDLTCGPTCLHGVYRFFGEDVGLDEVIGEVPMLEEGGTLAVFMGCHALRRGYRATIVTYNLSVFDPTWFEPGNVDLKERLKRQIEVKTDPKLRHATPGYLEFLELGGRMAFEDLTGSLLRRYLDRNLPILTGLSATHLYRTAREIVTDYGESEYDDLHGEPVGHFAVLCGFSEEGDEVLVADPLHPEPASASGVYAVGLDRLINAILLGVLTYDANLLIVEPGSGA
jgi:hypothetical protein